MYHVYKIQFLGLQLDQVHLAANKYTHSTYRFFFYGRSNQTHGTVYILNYSVRHTHTQTQITISIKNVLKTYYR